MQVEQLQVVAKNDGEIYIYQEDGTEHGAGIKLHADQIPLLCRGLLDAAGAHISDIPPERSRQVAEF